MKNPTMLHLVVWSIVNVVIVFGLMILSIGD